MRRRLFAFGFLVAFLLSASSAVAAQRPNVVVIMTDDQTVESMRVMPNVERDIADEGTTFDNSFVSYSLCCPSRATFLTGQYAHNHGVMSNAPPNGGYSRLDGSNTLPVWLQDAGYNTILLGKYLNGYEAASPAVPPGWTEWYGLATPYSYYGYKISENGTLRQYGTDEASYQTDVLAGKAVDVIEREAASTKPFFLWFTPVAPHSGEPTEVGDPPWPPTPARPLRYRGRFASEPLPMPPSFNEADVSDKPSLVRSVFPLTPTQIGEVTANYQQRLEALLPVDDAVARIINALASSGELDNTVLIFTSDNGFFHGEHRWPFDKRLLYEPSIRVPLVMRGPGIPKDRQIDPMAVNIDLAPTIVDLADATPGLAMDGGSLLPLLRDPTIPWRQDFLIERGPEPGLPGPDPSFSAVRTPRYLYAEYATGEKELYDLEEDPDELDSLHADPDYQDLRDTLAHRLHRLATVGPTPSNPPFELGAANDKLAFTSTRDGDSEIYVMAADGSSQTRLTTDPGEDSGPAWSPDGSQLAFTSTRDGDSEIYVMAADGSSQTRLTTDPGEDSGPAWSPDGSQLAFTSTRDGDSEIYVMAADGSSQTRLTTDPGEDSGPAWSPDGSQLAFTSTRDGDSEIYVMAADGSSQTRLTTDPGEDSGPAWSPDGSQLAFTSTRDGDSEIYVMAADGSSQTRLTTDPGEDSGPAWSPDGSQLAFTSTRDGDSEIYVMAADGSSQTRLTTDPGEDLKPTWRPASTAKVTGDTLEYLAGAGERNSLTISFTADAFRVHDSGGAIVAGAGCNSINENEVSCPDPAVSGETAAIHYIDVDTGDFNDTVTPQGSFPGQLAAISVHGGTGADSLSSGSARTFLFGDAGNDDLNGGDHGDYLDGGGGADVLNGGEGADDLDGGLGDDTLDGDGGDDQLIGGPDADTLIGGDGTDDASYMGRTEGVTADVGSGANDGNTQDGPAGSRDDVRTDVETLTGGQGDDTLGGSGGEDTLRGRAGNDTLNGGAGADDLNGGGGNDFVSYADRDARVTVTIDGSADDGNALDEDAAGKRDNVQTNVEVVIGGTGDDDLTGGSGDNALSSGPGDDTIRAGSGNDTLNGGTGTDYLDGGAGNDTADYSDRDTSVAVTIDGPGDDGNSLDENSGGQRDLLTDVEGATGGSGDDSLTGSAGENTLDGGGGDDTLEGGDGNDTLDGGTGTDLMTGGTGIDTATYADRTEGVSVTLDGSANDGDSLDENGTGQRDTVDTDVENLIGGSGADSLAGNAGENTLDGGGGDDTLDGGDGNDTLDGGTGTDVMSGGTGIDTATYADRTEGVTVTVDGNPNDGGLLDNSANGQRDDVSTDVESVIGGSGDDSLTGGPGDGTFSGGPGNDTLRGGGGADTLDGGTGTDTASYADRTTSVTVTLDGGPNDGSSLDDSGHGQRDNVGSDIENLIGGSGADFLTGGAGQNTLDGGGGDDALDGGDGNDTLNGGTGADVLNGGSGADTATYADRSAAVTVTLDGNPNDGSSLDQKAASQRDNVRTDVENVVGGSANDNLTGSNADNWLVGGDGNDTLNGGTGTDVMSGGTGIDTATYADRTAAVTVTLDGNTNDGSSLDQNAAGQRDDVRTDVENLIGGSGDDALTGGSTGNSLNGGNGNDSLTGGTGADIFNGGSGTDTATYADRTGAVTVTLDGSSNDGSSLDQNPAGQRDNVRGDVENLIGGSGDDALTGGSAGNWLIGGDGNDTMNGGPATDVLNGGSGTDTASYADRTISVTVTLDGSPNDGSSLDQNGAGQLDNVRTDVENVTGGSGADSLTGSSDANALTGGGGNDTLSGGAGADVMSGATGIDTAVYTDRTSGVAVTLDGAADDGNNTDGPAGARDNVKTDVENLVGGSGADVLIGSTAANVLQGGFGADTLSGLGGVDTVTYAERTRAVVANMNGVADDGNSDDGPASARDNVGSDVENLIGGTAGDTLVGSSLSNKLTGGLGVDTLRGLDGNDTLFANDGVADKEINCDGGRVPGTADVAHVSAGDPPTIGCESVGP